MTTRIPLFWAVLLTLAVAPLAHAQQPINPDFDRNGVVNSLDQRGVYGCINKPTSTAGCQNADVNGDGRINTTDYAIVTRNVGLSISASAQPAANSNGWRNQNVTVTFTCTGPFTACAPQTVVQTEGASQLIQGTVAGQVGASMATSVTLNIDKTAPQVTIASPAEDFVTDTDSIEVTGSIGDSLAPITGLTCNGVAATLNGLSFSCTVPLVQGSNLLTMTARDQADNQGTATRTVRYETDTDDTPLNVFITSPASLALFNEDQAPITVEGTVDDPDAAVVVTAPEAPNGVLAGIEGPAGQGAGGQTLYRWVAHSVPLREGHNLLTARAMREGEVATNVLTVNFDTTPPIVRIDSPSVGAMLTTTQAVVSGVVNDIVAGTVNSEEVTVKVNGVDAQVSNRTFVVPEVLLVRGTNTLTAIATDKAGNSAQSSIQLTVEDGQGQQRIVPVGGNQQAAMIASLLPEPLVVQLLDGNGQPVPDRPVTFRMSKSDGFLVVLEEQGQELTVMSDANGEASAQLQLGTRTGVGNNQVTVTSPGFTGEVVFSASALVGTPSSITRVSGENQRGQVGQSLALPFVAIVYDEGGNPVEGVNLTFKVAQGGGNIGGETEIVVPTNSDGKAGALLTLGQQEGINNQLVEVAFPGWTGLPVVFTASAVVAGNPVDTTVSGVVLDNADKPIIGALASIAGTGLTATTNSEGRFSIGNAPVGTIMLIVDGSVANSKFPFLAFHLTTVAGTDNTIGMPIYIPELDTENSKVVGGDEEVVLTMQGVPGVAFKIAPHSTTLPDGRHEPVRMVLSQVHADKVPMAPPNGTAPSLVWTLQPAGVHFDPPIEVQLPNTDGLAPGQVVEVFQFDHDLEQFVSVGQSRVSADGSVITTDPGFGVTKSGWGAPAPPPPPRNCTASCNDRNVCTSDSLLNPPCTCQNTPANDGASCGGPNQPGPDSCIKNATCSNGVCSSGEFADPGEPCDDGVFCTDPDQCGPAGVLCFGTKIEDKPGPSFSAEIKIADDIKGALNALKGVFPAAFEDASVTFTTEVKQTLTCCEEKQQKDTPIKELKYQATAKLETGKLPVPSLSFGVKGAFVGVFVAFGINGNVAIEGKNDLCKDEKCFSGGIGVGGTIDVGLGADVGVASISGSCGTGLEVTAKVGCGTYTFGLGLSPVACKFSIELFSGYVAFNVQKELIGRTNLLGVQEKPLPTF